MKKRPAIIIGGGPAGSATALYFLQAGIQPLIVEHQTFPRYHIGESLSGECQNSRQKLGLESAIVARNYPDKREVNVFNPNGVPFWAEVKRRCPGTHALIPNTPWSVARSSFDNILLDATRERGAEYMRCEAVAPVRKSDRVTESAAVAIQSYLGQETTGNGNPFVSYEKLNAEGQDAVRNLIDCFWEYPLAFTRMVDGARRDDTTDLFARRLYGEIGQNPQARQAMRKLMTARRAQLAAPNSQPGAQTLEEIASALA